MRKILFINIFILFFIFCSAQKGNIRLIAEYEDTLKVMAHLIMHAKSEEQRTLANNAFLKDLTEVLQYEKSFKYAFDSLPTIARLTSPDKKFRIFNWLLKKDDGSYVYYALVHHYNKKYKRYEVIPLIDNSYNIRNAEHKELDAKNWYGGLYYEIVYIKKEGRKFYTLLGWDGNDELSTKKIIDIMYFSGKNKIKFGLPIFIKNKKEKKQRVILEYDSKSTVSVRFHKKNQRIIFNHLIPSRKDLVGLEEYYVPDGSFNAYRYQKGKWLLQEDVEITNNSND